MSGPAVVGLVSYAGDGQAAGVLGSDGEGFCYGASIVAFADDYNRSGADINIVFVGNGKVCSFNQLLSFVCYGHRRLTGTSSVYIGCLC